MLKLEVVVGSFTIQSLLDPIPARSRLSTGVTIPGQDVTVFLLRQPILSYISSSNEESYGKIKREIITIIAYLF